MNYQRTNQAKANFDNVYHAPTPHGYFALMEQLGYRIGEEAQPYFQAAVEMIWRQNPRQKVQMLDLGCSYGVGAALVKYRFSMEQLVGFFDQEASRDYDQCVEDTQNWLREESDEPLPIRCVGVDCSEQAVQFAEEARLLDAGIAKNFEEGQEASEQEVRLMRHCNLMTSTGAIGYVTEKTLGAIFAHLGKALPEQRGPYMVMTILRLFDGELIKPVFQESGFHFERIPGVRLMQRRFADEAEQAKTLRALRERGVDAEGWETEGILYADLYAAAPRPDFEALWEAMTRTRNQLSTASETALET